MPLFSSTLIDTHSFFFSFPLYLIHELNSFQNCVRFIVPTVELRFNLCLGGNNCDMIEFATFCLDIIKSKLNEKSKGE